MADFRTAFLITVDSAHEGGYQCMHDDAGNWTGGKVGCGELLGTKYGIAAADHPEIKDIKNLTLDTAAKIYEEGYWKTGYSQINDQLIANKLFDMGVLFGVGTAVRILQRCLNVAADGIFGGETLDALNAADPVETLQAFKAGLIEHVRHIVTVNPTDVEFQSDWKRRIES